MNSMTIEDMKTEVIELQQRINGLQLALENFEDGTVYTDCKGREYTIEFKDVE